MYRPQSQASRRQKSSDIPDLQSKKKLPTKKNNKQSVKRPRQNTPSHIDSDRRLIIQSHANRNQLRQRLQRKHSQDDKDMWRSGLVRFIKPRLSERDYKRCKKLFEIFSKIQKCKYDIMAINTSSMKYMRETMSLHQNEVLKELKEQQLKLQTEEEKILLEIQNQTKENKLHQAFSVEKHNFHAKYSHLMQKDHNPLSELKPTQNTQNILLQHNSSSIHKRKQSSLSKKSRQTPSNQNTDRNSNYLFQLFEFMWNLDIKVRQNVPDKNFAENKSDWMLKGIKGWMKNKHEIIEETLVSLVKLCEVARKNFASNESSNQKDHSHKETIEKDVHRDNQEMQQSFKSPKIFKSYNQVFKSSAIKNLQKNFNQIQKSTINSPDLPYPNTQHTKFSFSFSKKFTQLQHYLKQINYLKNVNQRNDQLVKQLLAKSKQALQEKQQRQILQKQKNSLQKQLNVKRQYQDLGNLVKKDNELLKKRNQKLDQDNSKLLNEIHKMKNEISEITSQKDHLQIQLQKALKHSKQIQKYQKYYRQTLSLQNQLKILSQQNQKLIQQLKDVKQQYDQLITNTNKKQQQLPYSKPSSQQDKKKQPSETSHQKSIKQSSSTSLIYKQLEKNNKKLLDQNKKLQDINKELSDINIKLTDQNMRLNDQNKKLSDEKHSLSEENHNISELNHKLCQQGHKINEENKKLKDECNKLQENNCNLQDQLNKCNIKISQLTETNNSLTQKLQQEVKKSNQNTKLKEQILFLQQQNTILLQENKRISDQNKKIQQEFEYIVKQKLDLQSMIYQKTKQNTKIIKNYQKLIQTLKKKLVGLGQNLRELKSQKDIVLRQVSMIKQSVKEMFECINEQITSAFGIFVNEFSRKLYLQSQNSQKDRRQTQKVDTSIQTKKQEQEQAKQQQINQNLPTTTLQQQYQHQVLTLTHQSQNLVQQLNHCIYQLNTYKAIYQQVQIQKQIQKKYFQEDISQLKMKLTLVQKEYVQVKFQADRLRMVVGNGGKGKDVDKQRVSQVVKTEIRGFDNKMEFNVLGLAQPIIRPQQHTNHPTNLAIYSNLSSYSHIPQTSQRFTNLKINCESFSINITPSIPHQKPTTLQLQPQNHPQQHQQYQQQQQQLITFQSWLQQINLNSQPQTQKFKTFCSTNLHTTQPFTNPLHFNHHLNQMKQQNQLLKLELQRLKKDLMFKSSSLVFECRSPLKDILSPNQKVYTHFENSLENNRSNIMGSLYNRFNKLPNLQNNTNDFKQPTHAKYQHHQNNLQVYPPLQKPKTSKTQDLSSVKAHNDRITDKEQNKLPSSQEEQDQSFDLCII